MMRLAAKHADFWSWFAHESSRVEAFIPLLEELDRACDEVGRDPRTLERSIAVAVEPTAAAGADVYGLGQPLRGSAQKIAEAIEAFAEHGVTGVEILPFPPSTASIEALVPVIEAVAAG